MITLNIFSLFSKKTSNEPLPRQRLETNATTYKEMVKFNIDENGDITIAGTYRKPE